MALSNDERGYLEKRIDKSINEVKGTIEIARTENNRKEWQIQNDGDFALGWEMGVIFDNFALYLTMSRQRNPEQEDIEQAVQIITKRVREIKEAIFKCG